jgi:hypothetical protein
VNQEQAAQGAQFKTFDIGRIQNYFSITLKQINYLMYHLAQKAVHRTVGLHLQQVGQFAHVPENRCRHVNHIRSCS